jgi:hypothetical protein
MPLQTFSKMQKIVVGAKITPYSFKVTYKIHLITLPTSTLEVADSKDSKMA